MDRCEILRGVGSPDIQAAVCSGCRGWLAEVGGHPRQDLGLDLRERGLGYGRIL
jgi:hypothetical protein